MGEVKSIQCPKCAAPLNFLGGGRVQSITCTYCKSILDIEENFQILGNFSKVKFDHKIPFKIGMQGKLKGIDYTIIGRVRYSELHEDSFWDDLLLFSPLYGYAWLTYENGHTYYSKRSRSFPAYSWSDIKNIETFEYKDRKYIADEIYTARIDYIEGELTWVAKKYDKNLSLELYAPPYGVAIEKNKNELEYYELEYLDSDDVYETFNVPKDEQGSNNGIHTLKGFGLNFFKPLFTLTLWTIALVLLLILFATYDGGGKHVVKLNANNLQVVEKDFTISTEKYLNVIHLKSNTAKELNNHNIQIKENNEVIFSINKNKTYINPKIWTEDKLYLQDWYYRAKEVEVYLNLKDNTTYQLYISPVDNNISSTIGVKITESYSRLNYFIYYLMILGVILFVYLMAKRSYQKKIDDDEYENFIMTILKGFIPFFAYAFFLYLIMQPKITPEDLIPFMIALIFTYQFVKIPLYFIYNKIKGD